MAYQKYPARIKIKHNGKIGWIVIDQIQGGLYTYLTTKIAKKAQRAQSVELDTIGLHKGFF